MTTEIDYYELLECERTADAGTIKSSYRKLAMKYHPDKNSGCKDSEAQFKAVSEAYDCLKDPQKRAAYDRFGHAAFKQQGGGGGGAQDFGGFSDIFESVFGEFMGGAQRGGGGREAARRGADLRYDMEIGLEDAYHGKATEVTIDVSAPCDTCDGSGARAGTRAKTCQHCGGHGKVRAQQGFFVVERACPVCQGLGEIIADPCPDCRGEGRVEKTKTLSVNVPPGVDEGTRIRLSGEGEAGARGAPAGDLYIFLHVKRHTIFEREGTTLFARAPITFTTAALGGSIAIPGLDGRAHEIKIPVGIQSGKQIRQRGAGMPVLQGRGHGDLVVQIEVETPTKLSVRQRELLEMFRETETGDETPASQGFFAKLKGVFGGVSGRPPPFACSAIRGLRNIRRHAGPVPASTVRHDPRCERERHGGCRNGFGMTSRKGGAYGAKGQAMIVMTMLAAWLAMLAAADTPIGRSLRSILVERPAAWLSRFGRGHLALLVLMLTIGGIVVWMGGGDALRMMSMGTPEMVVWASTFEVATYLDVALALAVAASAIRVRMTVAVPLSVVRRMARPRNARARRAGRGRTAANDDDGDPDKLAA